MKKFAVFIQWVLFSIIIAIVYGILHDQITYSISPEYFTKFKFEQFGLKPEWFGGNRPTVAVIAFYATWWTGLYIGSGLGFTALIHTSTHNMYIAIKRSIFFVVIVTVVTGFIGFLYGKLYLSKTDVDWWFPDNLADKAGFITVGTIHNFSYLGGLLGLIAGVIYIIWLKYKLQQAKLV
jgi:hypothetical protein